VERSHPRREKAWTDYDHNIMDKVIKVPFSGINAVTLSGGAGATPIQCSTFGRIAAIADTFELYRFVRLKYRIHANATSRTGLQTSGYYPGIVDTTPTTNAQVGENLHLCVLGISQVVPSNWVNVSKSALTGYFPWYKTIAGSVDTSEEVQGNIYHVGAGTEIVLLEVQGVVEFKSPSSTGNTPAMRSAKKLEAERARIIKILGSPPLLTAALGPNVK